MTDFLAPPRSPRRRPIADVPADERLYLAAKHIGRWLSGLMLDLRVNGLEHIPATGAVVVAGNHRSLLDAPLVIAFCPRPATFLAKSELFTHPLAARALGALGQIPVDRGRPDREALRRAGAVLDRGEVLGMFPEGTRGTGAFDQIRPGIAYLVLRRPDVPIVPVACVGTERALPSGRVLPRVRARVTVAFGKPFQVPAFGDPRVRRVTAEATAYIRERLAAHLAAVEGRSA